MAYSQPLEGMVVMGNADTGLRLVKEVIFLLSQLIAQLVERLEYEKKIAEFNAYFTMSSKIAKAMNLRDVLEAVLYSSMEAVSAEATSVMLLAQIPL